MIKPDEMVPWWMERDLSAVIQMLATWAIKVKVSSTGGVVSDQYHQKNLSAFNTHFPCQLTNSQCSIPAEIYDRARSGSIAN